MKEQPAPGAARLLQQVPALAGLSEEHMEELALRCQLRAFRSGAQVLSGGEFSGAGVVLSGEIRLVSAQNGHVPIDRLLAGTPFAHESLFSGERFPYDAHAASDGAVLLLSKSAFDDWLAIRPSLLDKLRHSAIAHELRELLAGSVPGFNPDALESAAGSVHERSLLPGEMLIRDGTPSREVYVVLSGRLRVESFGFLERGAIAGDSALPGSPPAGASVVAETECRVYAIPADVFEKWSSGPDVIEKMDAAVEQQNGSPEPTVVPKSEPPGQILRWKSPLYAPPRRRFHRFPAIRQQSAMDCGAACLATVCAFYGKRVSLNRMRETARVAASGASMFHLLRAAQHLGFETIPMLATVEHLRANHLPAIVNWKGYHWIVVYQVGEKTVTVGDPASGIARLRLPEFVEGWTRYTIYLRPTPAFAELEESPPTLRQFTPYIRPHRRTLVEIGLASLAVQVLSLLLPMFTRFVIDDVIVAQRAQWLGAALAAVSAAVLLRAAVAWSRQRLLMFVARRVNLQLLSDFYHHVLRLPLPFFERRKVGDVISRLEENTKITHFFTTTGVDFFIDTITAVLYLALMLHYNVRLTAVAAGFLVLHILNIYLLTPRLQHGFRDVFQRGSELQSHTIEALNGLRTIRTLGIDHFIRWTWENLFARFTNAYFKTLKYTIASGLASQLLNNAGGAAVLFYGAWMVMHNQLTVGQLVAFTVLVQSLMAPVTKLVGTWDQLQQTLTAVERLNDVYESTPEAGDQPRDDLIVLPPLIGHVRFENVTFRYDPEGRNVLQNVNFEAFPGQRVAFVGRSGSGKSTLMKLLLNFYQPTTGRILVDGSDVSKVWLPSLRRQIGVVPQDSFLFQGTIRDNIAHSRPEAALSEVERAAILANAHEFITRLPQGYETVLAEQGSNLSGGQRQRIAIARAILQRPSMLVLDEATSALDYESERRFMQNLGEAFPHRTVFMIAHRLITVRDADVIVLLDHGNILEKGRHEELMELRGLYYLLSTQQLNL